MNITSQTTPTAKAAAVNAAIVAKKMKPLDDAQQAAYKASLLAAATTKSPDLLEQEAQAGKPVIPNVDIDYICKAMADYAGVIAAADSTLFAVLVSSGKAVPPIPQISKRYSCLNVQFREGLEKTGKYTHDSARTISGKLARIVMYVSNGFEFKTTNYNHAYDECRLAEVAYWTKKASSGKKTAPKTAPKIELGKLSATFTESIKLMSTDTPGYVKHLPHAIQIRMAIETLRALGVPVPKALEKMSAAPATV